MSQTSSAPLDSSLFDDDAVFVVSLNSVIREETLDYIESMDTEFPPEPARAEAELLLKITRRIEKHNTEAKPAHKILPPTTLNPWQVAQLIAARHRVVRITPSDRNSDDSLDVLALYQDEGPDEGIYSTSETQLRQLARSYDLSLSTRSFLEVIEALREIAPRVPGTADPDLIAVDNGIFDYRTKQLLEFSPDHVFLSKCRVPYQEAAQNVVIHNDEDGTDWDVETWMSELHDDADVVQLLWEALGACIRPNVSWDKALWLYSEEGSNGKGTYCALARNLVGAGSWASIALADFSRDFLLEPLTRASAIIVDENDVGGFIDRAANLKAIITNDVILVNRKYKPAISFQFRGFMIQCLNEFPRSRDKSESFYRRQLFVPMNKNFKGVERRYIKSDYLHRPEVLQYVLKRVLHMNYHALSTPAAAAAILNEYKEVNDPVREFWNTHKDDFVWDFLPFPWLHALYSGWNQKANPKGGTVSQKRFTQEITALAAREGTWRSDQLAPGPRLKQAEPLSVLYGLGEPWVDSTISAAGFHRKGTPSPTNMAPKYRGLVRI